MTRNFTTATDDSVIELIRNARHRLAVIAPGVTTPVAEALASRMVDLSRLSLTIILDADAEVYRMGYGDAEALTIIRNARENAMFDLREQPGIRIGVIISDDETMVYAPVSRNIEAGSNSIKHPNAIMVGTSATESLAVASGTTPEPESLESDADDVSPSSQEIGLTAFETEKVKDMEADLEANPPRPFDLTRRLPVFVSEVQFVELRLKNALLSSKKIVFPRHFLKFEDIGLREHTESSLKIPINLFEELSVKFESHREDAIAVETGNGEVKKFETMKISESDLKRERKNIEQRFYYNWIGRGHIILRRDKKTFQEEVDRLIAMTSAYQDALKSRFDQENVDFCKKIVKEFLEFWKKSPPEHLHRNLECLKGLDDAIEKICKLDLEDSASDMFTKAVTLDVPDANIIYKNISTEDLMDEDLMTSLRELMEDANVDQETLDKLFRSDEVIAPQDSLLS